MIAVSLRVYVLLMSLFAAFTLGLPRLGAAAPWLPLGPDGGDARRLASDPSDHRHLYLGTANGWIYESHTSGASWIRLAQIGHRDDLVLDSIVVDPANPKHLLVGAWVLDRPDGGLFTSIDGGHTWINQAEMRGQSVRALSASPSDPKVFVAGSLTGVFRTVDAGGHWSQISPAENAEIHEIQSVAVDPHDPNIIYAGTWHLPWKTTDGGTHWNSIKQGIIDDSDVFSIIVDPTAPQTVYASACSGIYKSEDGGDLFHKIQGIPSTARRTRVLLQDPHQLDTVFAGTTEGLFRSSDAGATWTRTTGPEIIVNDVSVDPSDSRHVLLATNRGGVLVSDDGGDTFHSSNGGFSARQIAAISRDAAHPSTLYVGVVNDKDWGGVFESENGGVNWSQRSDGLQGRDVFALGQAPDGTMIAGTAHGVYRMDGADKNWQRVEIAGLAVTSPSVVHVGVPGGRSTPPSHSIARARATVPHKAPLPRSGRPAAHTVRPVAPKKVPSRNAPKRPGGKNGAIPVRVKQQPAAPRPGSAASVTVAGQVHPLTGNSTHAAFDGAVYSLVTANATVLAATSTGLLASTDNGASWTSVQARDSGEWRLLASAKSNVVAGSLHSISFSADAGATWSPVRLPEGLTQLTAVAVEPSGTIWAGSREGVFVSADAGNTWSAPKGVYANPVNSIFYDEAAAAVAVTTAGADGIVFTIQLPQRSISYYRAGWALRMAYPVGDHLVAATLFDGLVVQPRMTVSPVAAASLQPSAPAVAPTSPPQR